MKSFLMRIKRRIYHFFTREINAKLDKIIMLDSAILARKNMEFLHNFLSANRGGAE
ncbi:hypothetical protein [Helicobacter sp. 23-1045]